jgi:hypothetical protein
MSHTANLADCLPARPGSTLAFFKSKTCFGLPPRAPGADPSRKPLRRLALRAPVSRTTRFRELAAARAPRSTVRVNVFAAYPG